MNLLALTPDNIEYAIVILGINNTVDNFHIPGLDPTSNCVDPKVSVAKLVLKLFPQLRDNHPQPFEPWPKPIG